MRVADSCTRVDDTLAIAALYRCLVRFVDRRPEHNSEMTGASRAIASENLWRAQRRGVHASFIDETGAVRSFAEHLAAILAMVAEDGEALGCQHELAHNELIASNGTSADHQLAIYAGAVDGSGSRTALTSVVDWLDKNTALEAEEKILATRNAV